MRVRYELAKEFKFECDECGAKLDRDVNAAINIKLLGQHKRLESGIDFEKRDNPLASDSSDAKIA